MAYNPSNPNGQATMANSEPVVIASDQSAVPVSDNGGSITVDGTVTVTQSTAANLKVDLSGTGANTTAIKVDGSAATQPVSGQLEVTKAGLWTLDSNSGVDIGDVTINNAAGASAVNIQDGGNSITVDGSVSVSNFPATQPVSGTITASNTSGDVAHDSPDSGNPVKIGFQAENVLAAPVANGDRSNAVSDLFGRQLIANIDSGMQVWRSANYTTQQTGAAIWTPSAGKRIAITYISVTSYATTAGRVILWFGAGGDTTYTAGTDQLLWAGSFAPSANSRPGAIIQQPFGLFAATPDHILRITTDAAISLDITVYGYEF